jgi:hypothetical protein
MIAVTEQTRRQIKTRHGCESCNKTIQEIRDCDQKHNTVLCQREIDQLLSAIGSGDSSNVINHIKETNEGLTNIEALDILIQQRNEIEPEAYGMFETNVEAVRFFNDKNSEEFLADIRAENEKNNLGNKRIPGTNIEIINYSVCPKCRHKYSMKDLMDYYAKPIPDPFYGDMRSQYKHDTRMYCVECGTYFLPALVIADGYPRNESQFLCRAQTIESIEQFYASNYNRKVLTKDSQKIKFPDETFGIRMNIHLAEMFERPGLVSNLLQYSPAQHIIDLSNDEHLIKDDSLYNLVYTKEGKFKSVSHW